MIWASMSADSEVWVIVRSVLWVVEVLGSLDVLDFAALILFLVECRMSKSGENIALKGEETMYSEAKRKKEGSSTRQRKKERERRGGRGRNEGALRKFG